MTGADLIVDGGFFIAGIFHQPERGSRPTGILLLVPADFRVGWSDQLRFTPYRRRTLSAQIPRLS